MTASPAHGNCPLRLDADDEQVYALTVRANDDSRRRRPSVRFVCDQCGAKLGSAAHTAHGPLFTSSWETPPGAQDVTLRRLLSRLARTKPTGDSRRGAQRDGVIALLALPPDVPQDYPDLMVRCAVHGDALLDRRDILRAISGQSVVKVATRLPRLEYRPSRLFTDAGSPG